MDKSLMSNKPMCSTKPLPLISCFLYPFSVCVFLAVFLPCMALAQQVRCVTVEGRSLINGQNPKKAKAKALENARKKAIYTAIANDISIDALEIALEIEGDIQGAIPYGVVTRENLIEEGRVTDAQGPAYRVKLKACCTSQKKKNPGFSITASLAGNKHSFKPGDTLSLNIRSSHDCYVYLFNLLKEEDGDRVLRWFPNSYDTLNFVKANQTLTFPRSETMKIRLGLPEGQNRVTDYIYILALKAPSDMKESSVVEGLKDEYGGKPSDMKDFITDLVTIPFSQRSEVLLKYRIIK